MMIIVQNYIFFWICAKNILILHPIFEITRRSNLFNAFKVMKKVLLIAAVALCAMSCGNKNAKCCEGSCCDSTAATEEVVVVEEDTTAADSAVVVEEVVEEAVAE